MKKLTHLICAFLLLFALTACAGGDGGDGGGVTPPDTLVSYTERVGNDDIVFKHPEGRHYIKRTADGIDLRHVEYMEKPISFSESSFQQEGKFKVSKLDGADGGKHTLYLGGQGTNLEYSEFGFWHSIWAGHTINSPQNNGDSKAIATPQTNEAFTGNAVVLYSDSTRTFHTGTATMQYNETTGWTLNIVFPKAFNISIANISMDDAGGFKHVSATAATVDAQTYAAYAPFDKANIRSIAGQFYGPEPTKTSEAVGGFNLYTKNWQGLYVAFGLKKK